MNFLYPRTLRYSSWERLGFFNSYQSHMEMCSFHSWKWCLRKSLEKVIRRVYYGGISLRLWCYFSQGIIAGLCQDQLASSGSWLSALKFLPWALLQTVKDLLSFPVSLALFSLPCLKSCILSWVVWSIRIYKFISCWQQCSGT